MAVTLRALGECRRLGVHGFTSPLLKNIGILFLDMVRRQSSQNIRFPPCYVPESSLCRPPWQEFSAIDPTEETKQHQGVILKVNNILAAGKFGRLFAVVHFASRQWKVTSEDMILTESHIDAECGDQIRLEKVLLIGGEDFTLIGRPLLGQDLVKVEATVVEKTQSWPKVHMHFWKRHRYQRKKIIVQPQTVLRINTIEVAQL